MLIPQTPGQKAVVAFFQGMLIECTDEEYGGPEGVRAALVALRQEQQAAGNPSLAEEVRKELVRLDEELKTNTPIGLTFGN
jgi:hypothetical protein